MCRLNGNNVRLQLEIKRLSFSYLLFYLVKQELKTNVVFSISPIYGEKCFVVDSGC